MPWLVDLSDPAVGIEFSSLALRLALAALFGCIIAAVYLWKKRQSVIAPTFPLTLVLLSVLIAMVTQVVGDHVARAFSLVGALSIVRFRTVVEDTQDIAFVIFAVVVGMALGSGDYKVTLIGSAVCIAVIILGHRFERNLGSPFFYRESTVRIRTTFGIEQSVVLQQAMESLVACQRLIEAESVRGGTALEWTYSVRFKKNDGPQQLIEKLGKLDGVQSVSWKDPS